MATRQNRSPVIKSVFRSVQDALGGRWSVSFAAWAAISPVGILVTSNSYSPFRGEIGAGALFNFGVVGVFSAGLVLWLAHLTVLRNRRIRKMSVSVVLLTYAFAGSIRSAIVFYLVASEVGIDAMPAPIQVIVLLGATHGVFWFTFFALLFNLAERHRMNRSNLEAISLELDRLESESEIMLRNDLGEVQEMIRNRLQPVLSRVTTQLNNTDRASDNLLAAATDLQETCERDVRELSHRLSEPVWLDRNRSQFASLPGWRSIFREGAIKADTYHYSVLSIAVYLLVFLAIAQSKYSLLENIAVLMLQAFGIAFVLDFGFWRRVSWKNTYLQVVAFYSVLLGVFTWLLLRDPEFMLDLDFRRQMFTNVPATFTIIWIVVSLLRAFELLEGLTKAEIAASQDVVEMTQRAYEKRRNQVRKALASLLHGKIQGRLAAVSLAMLSSANSDIKLSQELLGEAESQIRKVQRELDGLLKFDISTSFDEMSQVEFSLERVSAVINQWGGLLEVAHNFDVDSVAFINQHRLAEAVETSIQESLSNAVRHGKARKAEIKFDYQALQAVLVVINNGLPIEDENLRVGHGGRAILALNGHRSFATVNGQTAVVISWQLDSASLVNQ
jgi:signal transduction histidine kinase